MSLEAFDRNAAYISSKFCISFIFFTSAFEVNGACAKFTKNITMTCVKKPLNLEGEVALDMPISLIW
jgi:hypothetical protein